MKREPQKEISYLKERLLPFEQYTYTRDVLQASSYFLAKKILQEEENRINRAYIIWYE